MVITGGEPAIFEEIGTICAEARKAGLHITIETAGTIFRDWECDLWSISPKMSNSSPAGLLSDSWVEQHESRRWAPEVVSKLIAQSDYQLKFVIGELEDTPEVERCLAEVHGWRASQVMMMPQGTTPEELQSTVAWLAGWCQEHGFNLCDRKHIYWYGNTRGT